MRQLLEYVWVSIKMTLIWNIYFFIFKFLRNKSRGGVLVEFAISIPVLISVLYFSFDLPKHKELINRMKFATYCGVNMIQNISKKRASKKITKIDLAEVAFSVGLPIWKAGHKWMCNNSNLYPLGQQVIMNVFYIKGTGSNNCKIVWHRGVFSHMHNGRKYPSYTTSFSNSTLYSRFSVGSSYSASKIHPDLKNIKKDEVKILLEVNVHSRPSLKRRSGMYAWGVSSSVSKPPPFLFGYMMLPPSGSGSGNYYFYPAFVVFSPRNGLFTEVVPT